MYYIEISTRQRFSQSNTSSWKISSRENFFRRKFFANELRKPSTLSSSCGSNNVTEHFCHRNIEQTAEIFSCDLQSTCLSSLHATANGSSELVYSHDITFCCHVTMLEVSMTTLINPTWYPSCTLAESETSDLPGEWTGWRLDFIKIRACNSHTVSILPSR